MLAKHSELASFTSDRLTINGFILVNGLGYDKQIDSSWFADETAELARVSVKQNMTMRVIDIVLGAAPTFVSSLVYLYVCFEVVSCGQRYGRQSSSELPDCGGNEVASSRSYTRIPDVARG